jgi:predicted nucleic acid-binding protein
MGEAFTIYLDNCCLNRPFDDQDQDRVRLEAEAVTIILRHVQSGEWAWVGSDILLIENEENSDDERRMQVAALCGFQQRRVLFDGSDIRRAAAVHALGFGVLDAYHVAAAEKGRCQVLLTTDDRFLARAARHRASLRVSVRNPVEWLSEVLGR